MLSDTKVTDINKPSPNPFCSHKTCATSPCPESHLKEPFLSLSKAEETQQKKCKSIFPFQQQVYDEIYPAGKQNWTVK